MAGGVALGGVVPLPALGRPALEWPVAAWGACGSVAVYTLVRLAAMAWARGMARAAAMALSDARLAIAACTEKATARHHESVASADATRAATLEDIRTRWLAHEREVERARSEATALYVRKAERAMATHDRVHRASRERLVERHARETRQLEQELSERMVKIGRAHV